MWRTGVLLSAVAAGSYALIGMEGARTDALLREDGPVETLGAAGLLVAGLLFLAAAKRAREGRTGRAPAFLLLALLFVAGAGEEISWGQRIFGWQTPESVAQVNVQQETNLHNLVHLQGTLDAGRLFNLFTFGFVLALPLALALLPSWRHRLQGWVPMPPLVLSVPFIVNQLASKAAEPLVAPYYTGSFDLVQSITELKETNLSLLFVAVAVALWRREASPLSAAGRSAPLAVPSPQPVRSAEP